MLKCDMNKDCDKQISFIDDKGFIYCEFHGKQRKQYTKCKKLTVKKLEQINKGNTVKYE